MIPLIGSLIGGGAGAAGTAGGAMDAGGAAGASESDGKNIEKKIKRMKDVQGLAEGASGGSKEIASNVQKSQVQALNETTKAGTPGQVQGHGDQTTGKHGSSAAHATTGANTAPNVPSPSGARANFD